MKTIIRKTVFYSVALFLLPYIFSGFVIKGGLGTALTGGLVMTGLSTFLRPILNIISFPLQIISLGFLSFLLDALLLYLLTVFVGNITIHASTIGGVSYAGFVIPQIGLNTFFAYIISASIIHLIVSLLSWITR